MTNKVRDYVIIALLCSTSLAITPWNNLEGLVLPKFFVLVVMTSLLFSLSLSLLHNRVGHSKQFILLSSFLVLWTTGNLIFNNYSLDERIFGIYGRNLGVITYACLFFLLIPAYFFSEERIRFFLNSFLITSFLISLYFLIQFWNLDPANWQYVFKQTPNSTLGNPNFVSSYFGIVLVVSIGSLYLKIYKSKTAQIVNMALGIVSVFIVYETMAIQGMVIAVFLTSMTLIIWFLLLKDGIRKLKHPKRLLVLVISLILGLCLFLVTLAWGRIITTLGSRVDYWHNAIGQILDSPIVGQGFDTFGNRSLQFRTQEFPATSDSPHNLILELSSSAGMPLIISYVWIQILVIQAILRNSRILIRQKGKPLFLLILIWLGFHAQSLINPSTIPFLSLGLILTGVLYGQFHSNPELLENRIVDEKNLGSRGKKSFNRRISILSVVTFFTIVPFSGWAAFAPLKKDATFRDGIENGDGVKIITVTRSWPYNSGLSLQAAHILKDNNYPELAKLILEEATEKNKDDYYVWNLLREVSSDERKKEESFLNLRRLDSLSLESSSSLP